MSSVQGPPRWVSAQCPTIVTSSCKCFVIGAGLRVNLFLILQIAFSRPIWSRISGPLKLKGKVGCPFSADLQLPHFFVLVTDSKKVNTLVTVVVVAAVVVVVAVVFV